MLGRLFGRRGSKRVYVVVGDSQRSYVLIDGRYIPKENILSIDTANRRIVYVDLDGTVRVSDIPGDEVAYSQRSKSRPVVREVARRQLVEVV